MGDMCTTGTTLRQLGAEPFGARLRRARLNSGVQLRDAADRISRLMLTTHTSLARLEKLTEIPTDRHRRALAYLAMLCYGYDPSDLGLRPEDLPRGFSEIDDLGVLLRSRCAPAQPGMKRLRNGGWLKLPLSA